MIRLPWVSRARAEHAEAMAEFFRQGNEKILGWYHAERAKNEALNERLLSLKMTGAVEPPKPDNREWDGLVAPAPKLDELRDLIDTKSGGNLRVRGMMLKQLQADRSAGLNDEQIEARILAGVQSEGVPS